MIGRIERVDEPEPGLVCLSVRAPGESLVLLLSSLPAALGAGIVEERPRGRQASEPVSQLRRHLKGAMLARVQQSQRFIALTVTRAGTTQRLIIAPRKPSGSWWLATDDDRVLVRSPGAAPIELREEHHFQDRDLDSLRRSGASVLRAHREARIGQLERQLLRQKKRLIHKRKAILGDLERATSADELHERASLILAHASAIPPKAASFEATKWGDGERTVRIELDPSRSPAEHAQELFRKARRLRRGLDLARPRLEAVESQLESLKRLGERLHAQSPETTARALDALGVSTVPQKERARRHRQAGGRPPYRKFVAADDTPVLVGRSAADNDRLTLRVAKPHDLWLHAREVTGAHVVVPLQKGKSCSSNALVDAATLAAHFSDLRGERTVDVLYTPRRFVHKRKGNAVGAVTLEREKVIAVRVEHTRLARLLESELRT